LLSGGRGGLGVFMAPSAGYLVGYALAAGVTGALMRVLPQGTPLRTAASAFIASVLGGLVFLHAMGIAGLVLLAQMPLDKAFLADLVFVPGDLVKCALCAVVVHTVAKALPDWPFGGRER
ncbi:biotin transporter BioY, partial [Diaphorobacter sp.]